MKPTGYQRASVPFCRMSPATPRKAAADRYSPEMAAAFAEGPTVREATRKSDVLRAAAAPKKFTTAEAPTTSAMPNRLTTAAVLTVPPHGASSPHYYVPRSDNRHGSVGCSLS